MSTSLALMFMCAGQVCGPNGCQPTIQYVQYPQVVTQPIQADNGDVMFNLMRGRIESLAEEIAERRLNARLEKLAGEIENYDPDSPHRSSIVGALFATALVTLVKRVIYSLIVAAVMAAVIGLFWKHWVAALVVLVGLAFSVFCIALPAGMLGGRIARPRGQ